MTDISGLVVRIGVRVRVGALVRRLMRDLILMDLKPCLIREAIEL